MKIGLLVDGQSEFYALRRLLPRIPSPHVILAPLYADIQPCAPPAQNANAILPGVRILARKGAQSALVLIDWEQRPGCPGETAQQLASVLAGPVGKTGISSCAVVIKVRSFENWLVSDPTAFGKMPRRFRLSATDRARIAPNKADTADATRIIKASALDSPYDKVGDAVAILSHAKPDRMAKNSRSFRRLLRLLDCDPYCHQSSSP